MTQIIGDGWLADALREASPLHGVDQAVAFSGVDESTLVEAGDLLLADTPTLWTFTAPNTLGLLRTNFASSAPCPRCILYHLATLRGITDDVKHFMNLSSNQSLDAIDVLHDNAPTVAGVDQAPFVRLVDTHTKNVTESSVLYRHLGCNHTNFPDSTQPLDSNNLRDAAIMYAFFDPHFGPLRTVKQASTMASSMLPEDVVSVFSWFVNQMFVQNPNRYPIDEPAIGTDFSTKGAAIRAIMEALERRAFFAPPADAIKTNESEIPVLHPTSFYLYRDEQYKQSRFPFDRYDSDMELLWVQCQPVTAEFKESSEIRYVPADFVRVKTSPDVPSLVDSTTNGFAAHTDRFEAIRNGLLELFERDALLSLWHSDRSPRSIPVNSLPDPIKSRVGSLQVEYDVHIIDATRHEPFYTFAVICTADQTSIYPRVVVTGGCSTEPVQALRKALRECFGRIQTTLVRETALEVLSKEDVETSSDHIAFYELEGRTEHIEQLTQGEERIHFSDVSDRRTRLSPESIVSSLERQNLEAYWRDVTQDDLASSGVSIVRVLSPDLVPITFGYGMDRLNHPERSLLASESPDIPHPFP